MNKGILWFALLLLIAGCGKTEDEFSSVRCYLVINNQTHQDATLASAMNAASPGTFCKITQGYNSGANYFAFLNSNGENSTSYFDGEDVRRTVIVGLNNSLIVGFSNMEQPAKFFAFDGECPNCFNPDAVPVHSYPLQFSSHGIVHCNTCQRNYALNNQGIVSSGEAGKKLTRYQASTTGPFGVMSVQ